MGTWTVEIRGTITRDIGLVEVEAASMGEAMTKAVEAHPTYRAKAASEVVNSEGVYRIALARIVAVADGLEVFSEGQLANILAMDRVQIRELIDDGFAHILKNPLQGENGAELMKMLDLEDLE